MATILTCYYKPKPGGLCTRLFRAINALLARGHTVHYLSVQRFPVEHPNCHFHRFPWPPLHSDTLLFWVVFHLLAPWQLMTIGFRNNISHSFVFSSTYALLLKPLCVVKRIPVSLFIRADQITNHRLKKRPRWLIRTETILEGFAIAGTRLYGVSEHLTRQIVARHSLCKPKYAGTLPNNLPAIEKPLLVNCDRLGPLRVGCAGVLESRKNQSLLIRLASRFNPEDLQLFLFGSGPAEKKLVAQAESLGVTSQVHFTGWQESATIWPQIDLLAMPSLHEGAPNAMLEAIAYRVPVLASDIPEHREILPSNSLLSTNDIDAWTDHIAEIICDKAQHLEMLSRSQREAAGRLQFDWDAEITSRTIGSGSSNQ